MAVLNNTKFATVFPGIDRFFFPSTLVWVHKDDQNPEISESIANPLKLNYTYTANFRPECVGSRIPGLIGHVTFIHDGPWFYNQDFNAYHVRCFAKFVTANIYGVPPLSKDPISYTLDIGFAFVEPEETIIFLPPIHFHNKTRKGNINFQICQRIYLVTRYYLDPRAVCGISLYVTHNSTREKQKRKWYWATEELNVDQVLETFGVTPPIFRGYRLGRDGKLIIPPKPSKKNYPAKVPLGKKYISIPRWKRARRIRRKRRLRARRRRAYERRIRLPSERRKLRDRRLRMRKKLIPRRKPRVLKPKISTASLTGFLLGFYFLIELFLLDEKFLITLKIYM